MGMCLSCLGGAADDVVVTPDPEIRRRQLAEAAEKRQKEKSHLQTRKSRVVSRQHTGVSKIQKLSREKRKNRKRLKSRR
uniref:small VCP/p97-interacting protein isoform X2 n=1 Tax=Gasterosteus aculeatus aculeatus TaxID=481459 RepID=UPI001A99CC2F|nr:small VCP/p97-interacting protein isoform X2 [Gasterosteus aculeatus aculeatus]